jgi:hypothetical protein
VNTSAFFGGKADTHATAPHDGNTTGHSQASAAPAADAVRQLRRCSHADAVIDERDFK